MITKLTEFNHVLLKAYIKKGMTILDATLGNGYDTAFVRECLGESGQVIAMDVNEAAVIKAQEAWLTCKNVRCVHDGHEHVDEYVKEDTLDVAIYNLGYLPGSDKCLTTRLNTTLESLEKTMRLLKVGGVISMTFYVGHSQGKEEYDYIMPFLKQLPPKQYHVLLCQYANQSANAPTSVWIEKKS